MAAEAKRIKVTPETALAPLLEQAALAPVLLEADGALYRLNRVDGEEDLWTSYDPAAALSGIEAAAGSWGDVDAEAFKAFIYRAREEGSRPATRP